MSHFTYVPNEKIDSVMTKKPKCHVKQLKHDARKQGFFFTNTLVPCPCCSKVNPKALVFKKGNDAVIACVCGYRRHKK